MRPTDIPLLPDYHPEIDQTDELDDEGYSHFTSFVGILQWAVELGRIDIAYATASLSRFAANPRKGHLDAIHRVFGYLKKHLKSKLVLDARPRDWSKTKWIDHDWSHFYPNATEILPPNAPEVCGLPVQLNVFVDAAHATDLVTRRSVTGILIFANGAPIKWYSKRQLTIESSTFGSEFVALRVATEMIETFRYKLRMMGLPVDGPANTFCDNLSVVRNSSDPSSTLTKRHNSIAYHKVRESVAAGIQRISHIAGTANLADLLTKALNGPTLAKLIKFVLFR
jgi:hypothetical protein